MSEETDQESKTEAATERKVGQGVLGAAEGEAPRMVEEGGEVAGQRRGPVPHHHSSAEHARGLDHV
jgi:flagellar motor component MotA